MSCSKKLLICTEGKHCPKMEGGSLFKRVKKALGKCELDDFYKLKKAECFGLCKYGPIIKVEPDNVIYGKLDGKDFIEILLRHKKKKKPLKKLALGKSGK